MLRSCDDGRSVMDHFRAVTSHHESQMKGSPRWEMRTLASDSLPALFPFLTSAREEAQEISHILLFDGWS